MLLDLSIGDIILPSPKRLDTNKKDHLVKHILEHGQPKAVRVKPDNERQGKYKLIDGYHTIWSLRELGYDHVVAQIDRTDGDKNDTGTNGVGS